MVEDTFSSASLLEGMEASDGPKGVTVVRGQVRRKCGEGGGGAEWESLSGTEAKGRNKQSSAVFNLVPLPRGTLGRVWGPWRLTQRGGGARAAPSTRWVEAWEAAYPTPAHRTTPNVHRAVLCLQGLAEPGGLAPCLSLTELCAGTSPRAEAPPLLFPWAATSVRDGAFGQIVETEKLRFSAQARCGSFPYETSFLISPYPNRRGRHGSLAP